MCMCVYLSVPVPLPGTPEWNVRSKYTETHRTVLIYGHGSPPRRTLKYLHCTIYKVYYLQSIPFTACRRIFPVRACVCVTVWSSIHSQQSLSTSPACHSQISTFDSGNSVRSQCDLSASSHICDKRRRLSGLTGLNIDSTCATCRYKQLHLHLHLLLARRLALAIKHLT
ncbi:hypothetical protein FIM1_1875 [Kluyveromyces marxianus]|uniref:Uncharacterized protein n=1 Tax=Kluyveromyces marxianus TaxID=4911 RepID=A0ABX6EVS7_KLUMA|nr:hypothetical protein FIM1_1875 [Kluyveromyces marxianus]